MADKIYTIKLKALLPHSHTNNSRSSGVPNRPHDCRESPSFGDCQAGFEADPRAFDEAFRPIQWTIATNPALVGQGIPGTNVRIAWMDSPWGSHGVADLWVLFMVDQAAPVCEMLAVGLASDVPPAGLREERECEIAGDYRRAYTEPEAEAFGEAGLTLMGESIAELERECR